MLQRRRHFLAHNVGARRQHLAQLYVGGTKTFQRDGQPPAGTRPALVQIPKPWRHDPASLDQAQKAGNHFHQSRQAECMAPMPPDSGRTLTWPNPASAIMAAKVSRGGKRRMLSAR